MKNPNGDDLKRNLKKHLSKSDMVDLLLEIAGTIECNPTLSAEQKIDEIQINLIARIPGYVFTPQIKSKTIREILYPKPTKVKLENPGRNSTTNHF